MENKDFNAIITCINPPNGPPLGLLFTTASNYFSNSEKKNLNSFFFLVYLGNNEKGEQELKNLVNIAPVIDYGFKNQKYYQVQLTSFSFLKSTRPNRNYWKSIYLDKLDSQAIQSK